VPEAVEVQVRAVDRLPGLIQGAADGEIRLIPVVSIPAREMILLQRPDLVASLERGIADAEAGRLVDRGSFDKYLDEDEDDDD
jgi:predicted transcriptional regulator